MLNRIFKCFRQECTFTSLAYIFTILYSFGDSINTQKTGESLLQYTGIQGLNMLQIHTFLKSRKLHLLELSSWISLNHTHTKQVKTREALMQIYKRNLRLENNFCTCYNSVLSILVNLPSNEEKINMYCYWCARLVRPSQQWDQKLHHLSEDTRKTSHTLHPGKALCSPESHIYYKGHKN